jgi:hypothetical protein
LPILESFINLFSEGGNKEITCFLKEERFPASYCTVRSVPKNILQCT